VPESPCQFGTETAFEVVNGQSYYIVVHRSDPNALTSFTLFEQEQQDVSESERAALIDLYNATTGSNWTNNTAWLSSDPVSLWYGITTGIINGEEHVVSIFLSSNNLQRSIPNSILNLTEVETLNFFRNKLNGGLPDFSVLPNIEQVRITNNNYGFLDFETNFSNNNTIATFSYSPQKKDNAISIDTVIGADYNFSMTPVAGTDVRYQWYKVRNYEGGDVIINGANTNSLALSAIQIEDLDDYSCYATSPLIPELVVEREIIELNGPVSQMERDALIAIYNATGGSNWFNTQNWNTAAPVSEWTGVRTRGNKVIRLSLQSVNLNGQLPEDLGNLINLEQLYIGLGDLDLTGSIPQSIGNLSQLRVFWIQATGMSGELPESIGNLINLKEIRFLANDFDGPLPESLGNLTQLTSLLLSGNQVTPIANNSDFSGILPTSLGNLVNLEYIAIANNSFEGELPFNSPNAFIDISNNHFDFSDIEPFAQSGNYNSLVYSPQLTEDIEKIVETGVGADITLNVNDTNIDRDANDTAMNNIYQWYKDNVAVTGSNGANYTITNTQVSDSGDYFCEITNSILPDLTIVRAPITLLIDPSLSVIDMATDTELSIHPNPTKNWPNIEIYNLTDAKLSIYDMNGRLVISQNLEGNLNAVSVEFLQSGTYILKIEDHNKIQIKRFIKH
jgi:hypothetical protein